MQIKKYETKDRYGNSTSFEFFEGSADIDVPSMMDMPDHPGEPRGTDTVPAWLTPGEMVINKEATDMYGEELTAINNEGRAMQNGEKHNHPSEAMYAADGDVVPDTPMSQWEIYQYILSLGFEENAARGIMSNIRHEVGSSFDSSTVQMNPKTGNPVTGGGMGLFQWEKGDPNKPNKGGRYDTDYNNLLKFAKQKNRNWTDPKTQLDFMNFEMRSQPDDVAANEWRTWAALRKAMNNAATPGEAAQMFAKKYEGHAGDPQVARTTWADDQYNFVDPNAYMVNGVETYEELGGGPMPRPTELGKSFNLDDVVKKALYKEAGGLIPQYYDAGDRVRDYYRDGVPPSGSADTMSSDSTWDLLTAIKAKEQEELERKRKLFSAGKLDDIIESSLIEDIVDVPETIKELIVPPANSMYEGDELRDYYRDGIPMPGSADTMSSDSTWDQRTAEEKDMAEWRVGMLERVKELKRYDDIRKYAGVNEVATDLTEDSQDAMPPMLSSPPEIKVEDLADYVVGEEGGLGSAPTAIKEDKSYRKPKPEIPMTDYMAMGIDDVSNSLTEDPQDIDTEGFTNEIPPISDEYKVPEVFNRDDRHGTASGNYEEWKILNQRAKEAQALRRKGKEMGTSIETINNFSDQELRKLNAEIVAQKERVRKAKIREDYKGQLEKEQSRLESMITDTSVLEADANENKIALLQIDKKEALMLGNETEANNIQAKIDNTIIETGTTKVNGEFISNVARKKALNELVVKDPSESFDVPHTKEAMLPVEELGKKQSDREKTKIEKFFAKYFGSMFDGQEISRMAVMYLGSRAMGSSHNGSMEWAGKSYIKRMEAKDKAHFEQINEYIKGGKHTAKSIGKFKVSRNENDLIAISANGIASIEQMDKISVADKTGTMSGKKAYKLKVTMADGSEQIILSFDRNNPKEIPDNWTKDLTYDKNSPQGGALLKSNRADNVAFVKEYIKDYSSEAKGTVSPKYSNSKGGLNYMAIGTQAGTWATTHGFRPDLMPSVMEIALADMASDIGNKNKKLNPTEMKIAPYLNAALIRSSVAQDVGNVFSYTVDGKEQNMGTKEITSMNNRIMSWRGSGASLRTTESRTKLSSSYKELYDMFQADKNGTTVIYSQRFGDDGKVLAWKNPIVGDKEQYEAAIKNKKSNESLFHAWLRATL